MLSWVASQHQPAVRRPQSQRPGQPVRAAASASSEVSDHERKQVRVEKGRVYWKIFVDTYDEWSGQRSQIFGFVRRKDGAIFRAATYKAPETRTKSAIRGYVHDDHPEEYFTKYGIIYAEGA